MRESGDVFVQRLNANSHNQNRELFPKILELVRAVFLMQHVSYARPDF